MHKLLEIPWESVEILRKVVGKIIPSIAQTTTVFSRESLQALAKRSGKDGVKTAEQSKELGESACLIIYPKDDTSGILEIVGQGYSQEGLPLWFFLDTKGTAEKDIYLDPSFLWTDREGGVTLSGTRGKEVLTSECTQGSVTKRVRILSESHLIARELQFKPFDTEAPKFINVQELREACVLFSIGENQSWLSVKEEGFIWQEEDLVCSIKAKVTETEISPAAARIIAWGLTLCDTAEVYVDENGGRLKVVTPSFQLTIKFQREESAYKAVRVQGSAAYLATELKVKPDVCSLESMSRGTASAVRYLSNPDLGFKPHVSIGCMGIIGKSSRSLILAPGGTSVREYSESLVPLLPAANIAKLLRLYKQLKQKDDASVQFGPTEFGETMVIDNVLALSIRIDSDARALFEQRLKSNSLGSYTLPYQFVKSNAEALDIFSIVRGVPGDSVRLELGAEIKSTIESTLVWAQCASSSGTETEVCYDVPFTEWVQAISVLSKVPGDKLTLKPIRLLKGGLFLDMIASSGELTIAILRIPYLKQAEAVKAAVPKAKRSLQSMNEFQRVLEACASPAKEAELSTAPAMRLLRHAQVTKDALLLSNKLSVLKIKKNGLSKEHLKSVVLEASLLARPIPEVRASLGTCKYTGSDTHIFEKQGLVVSIKKIDEDHSKFPNLEALFTLKDEVLLKAEVTIPALLETLPSFGDFAWLWDEQGNFIASAGHPGIGKITKWNGVQPFSFAKNPVQALEAVSKLLPQELIINLTVTKARALFEGEQFDLMFVLNQNTEVNEVLKSEFDATSK